MTAMAIAVLWFGYSAALWGYTLVRGWCVTPANVLNWNYPASMAQATQPQSPTNTPFPLRPAGTVTA